MRTVIEEVTVASKTSILLLNKTPGVKLSCDGSSTKLTIYHIAAYRGMVRFVKKLLKNSKRFGIEIDCPDVNGITPLYLAKLNVGLDTENNTWLKMTKLIESHGGKLSYPVSLEAEHHVLYRHLYGSFSFSETDKSIFEELQLFHKPDEDKIGLCLQDATGDNFKKLNSNCIGNYIRGISNILAILLEKSPLSDNLNRLALHEEHANAMKQFQKKLSKTKSTSRIPSKSYIDLERKNKLNEPYSLLLETDRQLDAIYQNKMQATNKLKHLRTIINNQQISDLAKDTYKSKLEDIINKYSSVVGRNSDIETLKRELQICDGEEFCPRFAHLISMAKLYFNCVVSYYSTIDSVTFSRIRHKDLNFLQSRLMSGISALSINNLTEDFQSMRYLLDIVLDKTNKYDYLRVLSLGLSPETRLFPENKSVTDYVKETRENTKYFSEMSYKNAESVRKIHTMLINLLKKVKD